MKFSKLRFARLTEKFGKSGYLAVTLQKKFNQWRQRPKVDIHGEMAKFTNLEKILKYEENNLFNPITHDCWP